MNADSKEAAFQQDMIDQMVAGGWKLGDTLAMYEGTILRVVPELVDSPWAANGNPKRKR